jgi:hypothetical protein
MLIRRGLEKDWAKFSRRRVPTQFVRIRYQSVRGAGASEHQHDRWLGWTPGPRVLAPAFCLYTTIAIRTCPEIRSASGKSYCSTKWRESSTILVQVT